MPEAAFLPILFNAFSFTIKLFQNSLHIFSWAKSIPMYIFCIFFGTYNTTSCGIWNTMYIISSFRQLLVLRLQCYSLKLLWTFLTVPSIPVITGLVSHNFLDLLIPWASWQNFQETLKDVDPNVRNIIHETENVEGTMPSDKSAWNEPIICFIWDCPYST